MDQIQIDKVKIANYQVWPKMAADTFDQLVADIKQNGIIYPIILDETFTVIDGHHRLAAAKKVGLGFVPCVVHESLTDDQKFGIAHKANATTRTLTNADKRRRAVELRAERRSFRQIAAWLGVGKSTVERWIKEHERGVPSGTSTVIGNDGKEYPSRQPRNKQPSDTNPDPDKLERLNREVERHKKARQAAENEVSRLNRKVERLESVNQAQSKIIDSLRVENSILRLRAGSGADFGLQAFASFVGLSEDATAHEIDRAFRKARAKAHPDATGGDDWLSKRYNTGYDMFKRLYRVG